MINNTEKIIKKIDKNFDIENINFEDQKDFDLLGYRPIALSLQQRIQIRKEMLNASGHDSIK